MRCSSSIRIEIGNQFMLICEVKERAVNLKSFEGKELSTASLGRRLKEYSPLQRTREPLDLNMTKRYLALTGEDLKAEHEKATPISDIVGKRVRKV